MAQKLAIAVARMNTAHIMKIPDFLTLRQFTKRRLQLPANYPVDSNKNDLQKE
jgi:hypothetical protein